MAVEKQRTVFYNRHMALGAQIVAFGGWEMPLQYPSGIVKEHLLTRKSAGLFDVSHMGRFLFRGKDAVPFLQFTLTNNAAALEVGEGQYTLIQNENGGAIDDAYLYRFFDDEYLLVVNAANREKDWVHFKSMGERFRDLELTDKTEDIVMISLQGPRSKEILSTFLSVEDLPDPIRNRLSIVRLNGADIWIARTGYTGEPIGFEFFTRRENGLALWDLLLENGALPVGLGARDTLRLEAGLPLYGQELGSDPEGNDIPIFASPLAKFAVSFSPVKGDFLGKSTLEKQFYAFERIIKRDFSKIKDLPQMIMHVAITEKGVARSGFRVFFQDRPVGWITSGTMVPFWRFDSRRIASRITDKTDRRGICLALLSSDINEGDRIEIEIRGKRTAGIIVPYHMRNEAPPYARPILYNGLLSELRQLI